MTVPAMQPPWTPGDEIRKARKDAGLKQVDLAVEVGVDEKTVSRWENGNGEPSITQWRAIARITGATWLLTSPESPNSHLFWQPGVVVGDGQLRLDIVLPPGRDAPELAVA